MNIYAHNPPPTIKNRVAALLRSPFNALASRKERRSTAILSVTPPSLVPYRNRSERRALQSALEYLGKRNPKAVSNWYQGGFPFMDGTASWIPSIIQDARYDQNQITRRELMRRMRFWSQNSGICKSTLDVSRQYTIGTHCPVVTSLAKDSKWAEQAELVFEEMIKTAGIDGDSLYQMLTVAHDCKKVDGDILFVETSIRAPFQMRQGTKYQTEIIKSVPRLQMVEGHRIETPPNKWDREGKDIVDGVLFNIVEQKREDGQVRKAMVRVGYFVKDSTNQFQTTSIGSTGYAEDSYSFIPTEGCLLVYTPTRVNQIRGLSDYYAGETTLALLEDLKKLETRAQEVQSNLTVFITNGAGQLVDQKTQATLGALNIKVSKDANNNPIVTTADIEKAKQVYDKIWGGEKFIGRTNDTIEFLAPNRPAEATRYLWEYLTSTWCAAAKAPRILVFPKAERGQGTEVRAELDKANSAFIGEFNLNWKPLIQRVWEYFIGWAIENDSRCANPPADWKNVEVSPPRSVLVDSGYDSASMLAELAAGVTNLHFIAQRLGTTRKKLIAAAVSDIKLLKEACAIASGQTTEGITVSAEEVRQSLSDVVKNLAAMKTADAAKTNADNQENA